MSWGSILGVIGLILAGVAAVWYKYRAQSSAMDAWLAEQAKSQANEAQELAEKQLADAAARERQTLEDELKQVKEIEDPDVRRGRLLSILVRLRGAH